MSTPSPDDPRRPVGDTEDDALPRSSNLANLLWILGLVALILIGIWWYQQETKQQVPAPETAEELPAVEEPRLAPAGPGARQADEVDRPDVESAAPGPTPSTSPPAAVPRPQPKPVAAAPRDRGPVPLPGNRQPKYPGQALRSGVQGSVSVLIEIDARGVPTDVRVVSRSGERSRDLDRAVVTAARTWRFDPAIRNGQPVPGEVILPVVFQRD